MLVLQVRFWRIPTKSENWVLMLECRITPAGKKTPQGNPGQSYLAFVSALWFYMTPQPPKPSMSDTVRGVFGDFAAPGSEIGFGDTTNIINGAQECGGGSESRAVCDCKSDL